jgi:histidinol phosphatase-like enzyme
MQTGIPLSDTSSNLVPMVKLMPALCLDLDGTVRRSKTGVFIKDENDIELMPRVEKIIHQYRAFNWLIIGISNQGGVAHGHKRPSHIERELDATLKLFSKNPFHIIKMCYHMEDGKIEPFNHRSLLRKPDIGMLALAEMEAWNAGYMIDWDNSLFVGDRPEDEECAKNARIKFRSIQSFLNEPHEFTIDTAPTPISIPLPKTLEEAIDYLLPRFEGMEKEFKQTENEFASMCHSQLSGGIGMKIRNEFGFWTGDTEIFRHMKEVQKVDHPDDMSDLIIRGVYKKFNKQCQ